MKYRKTEEIWEEGKDHHPKAVELMDKVRQVESQFDWKFGGDGDNGEEMLLILTSIFEAEDKFDNSKE